MSFLEFSIRPGKFWGHLAALVIGQGEVFSPIKGSGLADIFKNKVMGLRSRSAANSDFMRQLVLYIQV